MHATISAIEYHLPGRALSTEELAAEFPEWSVHEIATKTGINRRPISAENECASDLAAGAAQKLFESGVCKPREIDYLLLCTQSPDYFIPATACVLQRRLGLPTRCGALDFNLGCSGFVYGLGLAEGLIASGQARNLLLITADTFTKFLHPRDISVRSLFGDAAAATLLTRGDDASPSIGPFEYGTDGRGEFDIIIRTGGMRHPRTPESGQAIPLPKGASRSDDTVYMNGPKVTQFILAEVPAALSRLLARAGVAMHDIDLFVLHQANGYILMELRNQLKIPVDKFQLTLADCGNTSSASIPIALKHACREQKLRKGSLALLLAFGVGYSVAATLVRWSGIK